MIQQMLQIWSLVALPFQNPAWTSISSWFTHCWSLAWRIFSITLLALNKTLESPLDSKEIQSVILKEISPEYSLGGLMLKLKFQYFSHLIWRTDSSEKTPCLLRNLYAGQEATVRTGHGTTDWFQIGKGVHQGCILSPCLFNLYAQFIMRNAGLDEAQAGIKIVGEISITSYMQMTPHLWQKVKKN